MENSENKSIPNATTKTNDEQVEALASKIHKLGKRDDLENSFEFVKSEYLEHSKDPLYNIAKKLYVKEVSDYELLSSKNVKDLKDEEIMLAMNSAARISESLSTLKNAHQFNISEPSKSYVPENTEYSLAGNIGNIRGAGRPQMDENNDDIFNLYPANQREIDAAVRQGESPKKLWADAQLKSYAGSALPENSGLFLTWNKYKDAVNRDIMDSRDLISLKKPNSETHTGISRDVIRRAIEPIGHRMRKEESGDFRLSQLNAKNEVGRFMKEHAFWNETL